jgi:hypothetical protein
MFATPEKKPEPSTPTKVPRLNKIISATPEPKKNKLMQTPEKR